MHVPLLFWAPARLPQGRRIAAPVSLIDVVPTLVSLLGLPLPANLDGIDLSPVMLAGEEPPTRTLFAEARAPGRLTGPKMLVHWNPPLVTVRSGANKFIVHRPPHGEREPTRRYDLASDPDEQSPRLLEGVEKQAIESLVDSYLSGAAPVSAPLLDDPGAGFDPETEAQLRGLGYLD
jgi:choline-sulfatase